MHIRTLLISLTALLLLAGSGSLKAEIAVVVNPDSGVTQMTQQDVINIYMGRYQGLPSGITAFPVDLAPIKADFYQRLVDKTPSEINSYWARLVFSGRASPPRQLHDTSDVIEVVSNNKGAIGYLDLGDAKESDRVRVVLEITR